MLYNAQVDLLHFQSTTFQLLEPDRSGKEVRWVRSIPSRMVQRA